MITIYLWVHKTWPDGRGDALLHSGARRWCYCAVGARYLVVGFRYRRQILRLAHTRRAERRSGRATKPTTKPMTLAASAQCLRLSHLRAMLLDKIGLRGSA